MEKRQYPWKLQTVTKLETTVSGMIHYYSQLMQRICLYNDGHIHIYKISVYIVLAAQTGAPVHPCFLSLAAFLYFFI